MSDHYMLVDSEGNATIVEVEVKIGRAKNNDIVLSDPLASRLHATVYLENTMILIRDEKSVNGVLVNGKKIYEPTVLNDQDQLQFGDEVLTVRHPLAEAETIKSTDAQEEVEDGTLLQQRDEDPLATVLSDDHDPGKSPKEKPEIVERFEILEESTTQKDQRRKYIIMALILVTLCLCCSLFFLIGYLLVKGFLILIGATIWPKVMLSGLLFFRI